MCLECVDLAFFLLLVTLNVNLPKTKIKIVYAVKSVHSGPSTVTVSGFSPVFNYSIDDNVRIHVIATVNNLELS